MAVYRFFDTKVPGHAEDLSQKTFLASIRARERYRAESSFRVFLLGVARIELLRHLRSQGLSRDPMTMSCSEIAANDGSLSGLVAQLERRDAVLGLLRTLPLEFQLVVELHYWEGLSVEDIAVVLELPAGTVKSRLHRARAKLREVLEVAGIEDFEGATRRAGRQLLGR